MAQAPSSLQHAPTANPSRAGWPGLLYFLTRQSVRSLTPEERQKLVTAQVEATRPVVSGVLLSSGLILGFTGMFEAAGVAPGIGYPWWVVVLVALTVAGCALAVRLLDAWRPRLLLTLLATVLVGVFMTIPPPGVDAPLPTRTGLFQLLPIALMALMVRPVSLLSMIAVLLGLAALRVALHGGPAAGQALYWLNTATVIGFGLLLGGYRTDFAVATFVIRQRLKRQASTDELTGLRNRAGWNRDATEAYNNAVSRGRMASFAFFDIDLFKHVNDSHGHETGDRVLQRLGQIIHERLGEGAIAARLCGEEFVVLFLDQPPEVIEGYAQRVRAAFAEDAREFGTTVSAGIAHRQAGESMGQHLRRADVALYEAKASGRDRMVVSRA
jgi:diguanylate cyclase (GGDEF)-like protein